MCLLTIQAGHAGGRMLRSRARKSTMDEALANQLKEHQRELVKQKQEEGLKRFSSGDGNANDENEQVFKKFESYRRENQLPQRVEDLRVRRVHGQADVRSWSVSYTHL